MARVFSMSAASSPSSRLVAISRASARKRLFWVSQLSASLSELAEKQAPSSRRNRSPALRPSFEGKMMRASSRQQRSEEHTSELQSLMRISYAVFCLKKKKKKHILHLKQSLHTTTNTMPISHNNQDKHSNT